jgi:hypothetical protein
VKLTLLARGQQIQTLGKMVHNEPGLSRVGREIASHAERVRYVASRSRDPNFETVSLVNGPWSEAAAHSPSGLQTHNGTERGPT